MVSALSGKPARVHSSVLAGKLLRTLLKHPPGTPLPSECFWHPGSFSNYGLPITVIISISHMETYIKNKYSVSCWQVI